MLAGRTELHPIATDVASGTAVDLHDQIVDEPHAAPWRCAPRPRCRCWPGRRCSSTVAGCVDAGLSAAIPFRAALADGATHVLVLRSRRAGETAQPPTRVAGALTARLLRRLDPAVAQAFLTRAEREAEDEAMLARHDADPSLEPPVLSIRPAPGRRAGPLERDVA